MKLYKNTDTCKAQILSENKNKSGIYMWKNLVNGKQYIGSAVDLYNRLKLYYSKLFMENYLKKSKSYIYNAILKHGHENLSLTILEYCDKEKCIEREDFFLSSLPHEYNILEKAGSSLGRKHSDKTRSKISDTAKKSENSGRFQKGENHPMHGKPRPAGSGKPSQKIEVTDSQENTTTSYNSMVEAARALNLPSHKAISNYILNNQVQPYKGRYTIKKVG
jgi:hypothetical protein